MPYWLVTTGDDAERGINGGMMPQSHPGAPTVNTVGVASVDETLISIERKGGKVALPKMAVPGVGWLAYCVDPEGTPSESSSRTRRRADRLARQTSAAIFSRSTLPPDTIATATIPAGARTLPATRAAVAAAPEPST